MIASAFVVCAQACVDPCIGQVLDRGRINQSLPPESSNASNTALQASKESMIASAFALYTPGLTHALARYLNEVLSDSASAALTCSELMGIIQTASQTVKAANQTIETASAELARRSKSELPNARTSNGDPSMDITAEVLSGTDIGGSLGVLLPGTGTIHRAALWKDPPVPPLEVRSTLCGAQVSPPPKRPSPRKRIPGQLSPLIDSVTHTPRSPSSCDSSPRHVMSGAQASPSPRLLSLRQLNPGMLLPSNDSTAGTPRGSSSDRGSLSNSTAAHLPGSPRLSTATHIPGSPKAENTCELSLMVQTATEA